jgi:hypothetical protein
MKKILQIKFDIKKNSLNLHTQKIITSKSVILKTESK